MRRVGSEESKVKKNNGKKILIVVFILLIILGSFLGYSIHRNGGGLKGLLATLLGQSAEKLENLDTINILVLRNK